MSAPAPERIPAAKVGWLLIALTLGWVVLFVVPWPVNKPDTKPAPFLPPPSKLQQVGLKDYTDWEGLPEIFAIWADKAEWKDNRTRFAYWHPVAKTYSYYFEATRVKDGFRFKEIAEPHDPDHTWDESLGEDCPIRFYRRLPPKLGLVSQPSFSVPDSPGRVEVKLDGPSPAIQKPELNVPPPKSDPKR